MRLNQALSPSAVLLLHVVLFLSAIYQRVVLSDPVVLAKEDQKPYAVLYPHDVFEYSDQYQLAVLRSQTVLLFMA